MPPLRITSPASDIEELPDRQAVTSSSGRVVKPSAFLKNAANIEHIPGQPRHQLTSSKRSVDSETDKGPKAKKKKIIQQAGSRLDSSSKQGTQCEVSTVDDMPANDRPVLDHEDTHPDGLLKDLDSIDLAPARSNSKHRTLDLLHFFSEPYARDDKKVVDCKICKKHNKGKYTLVNEVTTCRRHMEYLHEGEYTKWCESTGFTSKLPKAVKTAQLKRTNSIITEHFEATPPQERALPYSDERFKDAAVKWLVSTDQPISSLTNPSFINMIEVASRAKDGVRVPSEKATRVEIMAAFNEHMLNLKNRLASETTKGTVSLTCDAWQASNIDGYFAVTGHWIEQSAGKTSLETAVLGFVRMNGAHNGRRLGQALFKVTERMGISHKVGWVTCDNASNNDTMMVTFSQHLEAKTQRTYCPKQHRIRCLAHIINLATQALISAYSKAPHYNAHDPDGHVPEIEGMDRDVIGLIRAIAERSSAKRKEIFRTLQVQKGSDQPVTLLVDMVVRWSSTYLMLDRAYKTKDYISYFLLEIASLENDRTKADKLRKLELTPEEWETAKSLLQLLGFADIAQQKFSSETTPMLHNAIPTLEGLHAAWSKRASGSRTGYQAFTTALQAALAKINTFYSKTEDSDAYVMAIVLHPAFKLRHFKKHWGMELTPRVTKLVEDIFAERWRYLTAPNRTTGTAPEKTKKRRFDALLHAQSDSDDEMGSATDSPSKSLDPERPWLDAFNAYINTKPEDLPDTMSVIEWWAVNEWRFPIWAALAWDYLAIMASSVSSERAFSSAGITITKRRNRLKGDIVEALQVLKSAIRRNLLLRDPEPSAQLELDLLIDPVEDEEGTEGEWGLGLGSTGEEIVDEQSLT